MKKSSYFWEVKDMELKIQIFIDAKLLQFPCMVRNSSMNVIHSLAITLYEVTNQIVT